MIIIECALPRTPRTCSHIYLLITISYFAVYAVSFNKYFLNY